MKETETRGNRKVKKGIVVSNKMQKTVIVKVERDISPSHLWKSCFTAQKNIMRIMSLLWKLVTKLKL